MQHILFTDVIYKFMKIIGENCTLMHHPLINVSVSDPSVSAGYDSVAVHHNSTLQCTETGIQMHISIWSPHI